MASSGCTETVYQINLTKLDFILKPLFLIKVLGDGSCFFHAVLRSFNREYIRANTNDKRQQLTQLFRSGIALSLEELDSSGVSEYDKLGGGSYAEYNKAVSGVIDEKTGNCIVEENRYSLKGLQKELLSNSFVDHAYIEIISNHINKDIYLISASTGDIYTTGTDLNLLYKHRDSIVILYTTNHYDIIGIKRISNVTIPDICNTGDIIFDCLFDPDHELIQSIRRRLDILIRK